MAEFTDYLEDNIIDHMLRNPLGSRSKEDSNGRIQ